ncbi:MULTISPECIES: TIGR03943 family putative permease subunit [unclassified Streptomyces]|uniref:TIGR03943 family putative permease subunit n=1 Tax=unclassified Streptomyces TaxID=2593676 RepID=UPI003D75AD21
MNRQSQTAVLFLLGASLLHAGTTDLYLRYVKGGLRPLLLTAGAVLVAAALASVWYARKAGRPEDRHPGPRVSWLLVLPVLALVLVAPPALGSYSATRAGTALQEPVAYPALPSGDPLRLGVADYAGRAVYADGRGLAGRRIEITGFLAVDGAGAPYLVRMALSCCAADAQPIKIALTGEVPPVLQPDTWLRVSGGYSPRVTKDPVNGGPIPSFEVTAATPVPVPHDPYDEDWNT